MRTGFLKHCLIGMTAGVAANELVGILISYALRLGYFMPYPASLPERVGGELNAMLLALALCALLGAGVGAAWHILRARQWRARKRLLCSAAAMLVSLMPAAVLTLL